MKTIFINGSPKRKFSVSQYFLKLQGAFVKGSKVFLKLRNRGDYRKILEQIADADAVVFSMPLYVDNVPSHVLAFLREMETVCHEKKLNLKVYVIANNGFIEGNQNAPLLCVMENFCARSNIEWCGGIGIGGGVMFNALRIVFLIVAAILLLSLLISGIAYGNWFPIDAISGPISTMLIILFFHLGVFYYMAQMAVKINNGEAFGNHYTRILLPSFLFIVIADAYFVIASLFQGGLFRGWLKRK